MGNIPEEGKHDEIIISAWQLRTVSNLLKSQALRIEDLRTVLSKVKSMIELDEVKSLIDDALKHDDQK